MTRIPISMECVECHQEWMALAPIDAVAADCPNCGRETPIRPENKIETEPSS